MRLIDLRQSMKLLTLNAHPTGVIDIQKSGNNKFRSCGKDGFLLNWKIK